jgi:hypothetical protein
MSDFIKELLGFTVAALIFCFAMVMLKEFDVASKEAIGDLLVGGLSLAAVVFFLRAMF